MIFLNKSKIKNKQEQEQEQQQEQQEQQQEQEQPNHEYDIKFSGQIFNYFFTSNKPPSYYKLINNNR